jgi:hypothetical protein
MVVDILAIIDGSALQLAYRTINFADRLALMRADGGVTRPVLEHPSRSAQVRQRVQVGRMSAGLACTPGEKQRKQEHMTMKDKLVLRIHCKPPDTDNTAMRDRTALTMEGGSVCAVAHFRIRRAATLV